MAKRINKKARQPTNQNKKIVNTGYSEGGASHHRKSLAGYNPIKSSVKSDIDMNLPTLRNRSSDVVINTPIAASAINTSRTNVIGAGLKLSARIKHNILGLSIEEAKKWSRHTMEEFDMWAMSKHCDLYQKNNFYDLQDIAYQSYLIDGDSWAAFKYRVPKSIDNPYSLKIQLFEASRVSNPSFSVINGLSPLTVEMKNHDNGNRIISGVEINDDGAVVAYWISNRVPYDLTDLNGLPTWQRVEAFGRITGEPNILQISHEERPEQYRGVPYLAPVIEVLKQVSRYSEAELTSAIIKSFFTLFFTEGSAGGDLNNMLGETYSDIMLDPGDYALGPGTLNLLPPGYDVKSVDAGRTLSTFEPFTNQLIKQIGAAIEQPYEVLMKSFNSSYSASRAALLQAWSMYKVRRTWFSRDFCQPIYERWLTEAIAIGRIKAPGFYDDPLIRKAWCNAEWYGPVMGMIDPVKDANGSYLRRLYGISTGEKEAAEMTGSNYDENIEILAQEKAEAKNKGLILPNDTKNRKGGEEDEDVLENKESD